VATDPRQNPLVTDPQLHALATDPQLLEAIQDLTAALQRLDGALSPTRQRLQDLGDEIRHLREAIQQTPGRR
jgi:hypothetical protein